MSARQWKPGDVALVSSKNFPPEDIPTEPRIMGFGRRWNGSGGYLDENDAIALRPLVVIDPEDEETAKSLAAYMGRDNWRLVREALRSLIADPKPDEPQGLGAVVEDAEGERWVRSHTHVAGAPWTRPNLSGTFRWGQVDAVRVLSEGWSE